MASPSSIEVTGITLSTREDGSISVVSGPQRVEIHCKALDELWKEKEPVVAPMTPEVVSVVDNTERKEPAPCLEGWRRTVHAAAKEYMKDIEERVECAEVFNDLDDYPIYQKLLALTDALRTDPDLDRHSADETLELARMYLYLCDLDDC